MNVIPYEQAVKVFSILNGRINEKDKFVLYYDEHDDKINAGYSYQELASLNDRIVIPRNIIANMTEGIFNLYANKLKERIKLNKMKEDFQQFQKIKNPTQSGISFYICGMNWNELQPQLEDILREFGFNNTNKDPKFNTFVLNNPCKRRPSPRVAFIPLYGCNMIKFNTISYTLFPNGKESFTSNETSLFVDRDDCKGFSSLEDFRNWCDLQKTIIDKAILLHKKEELADKEKKLSKDF